MVKRAYQPGRIGLSLFKFGQKRTDNYTKPSPKHQVTSTETPAVWRKMAETRLVWRKAEPVNFAPSFDDVETELGLEPEVSPLDIQPEERKLPNDLRSILELHKLHNPEGETNVPEHVEIPSAQAPTITKPPAPSQPSVQKSAMPPSPSPTNPTTQEQSKRPPPPHLKKKGLLEEVTPRQQAINAQQADIIEPELTVEDELARVEADDFPDEPVYMTDVTAELDLDWDEDESFVDNNNSSNAESSEGELPDQLPQISSNLSAKDKPVQRKSQPLTEKPSEPAKRIRRQNTPGAPPSPVLNKPNDVSDGNNPTSLDDAPMEHFYTEEASDDDLPTFDMPDVETNPYQPADELPIADDNLTVDDGVSPTIQRTAVESPSDTRSAIDDNADIAFKDTPDYVSPMAEDSDSPLTYIADEPTHLPQDNLFEDSVDIADDAKPFVARSADASTHDESSHAPSSSDLSLPPIEDEIHIPTEQMDSGEWEMFTNTMPKLNLPEAPDMASIQRASVDGDASNGVSERDSVQEPSAPHQIPTDIGEAWDDIEGYEPIDEFDVETMPTQFADDSDDVEPFTPQSKSEPQIQRAKQTSDLDYDVLDAGDIDSPDFDDADVGEPNHPVFSDQTDSPQIKKPALPSLSQQLQRQSEQSIDVNGSDGDAETGVPSLSNHEVSDLLQLLDLPPDTPISGINSSSEQPTVQRSPNESKAIVQSDSALQPQQPNEIQSIPLQDALFGQDDAPSIQRDSFEAGAIRQMNTEAEISSSNSNTTDQASDESGDEKQDRNMNTLVRDVYRKLRKRLEIEQERRAN